MLKEMWTTRSSAERRVQGARAKSWDFSSLCLGEFLSRLQRVDPHPAVLDLGVLCGDNIAFLGERGCRVSVESLPDAVPPSPPSSGKSECPEEESEAAPTHRSPLSYSPGSFAGVLAWDAIGRMAADEAVGFVETLRRLLQPGGVVLAYFPGPPGDPGGATRRFRILAKDRVTVESSGPHPNFKPYENRQIYGIFSRFDVVRLSHLKTGTREVLVAKSRRPAKT